MNVVVGKAAPTQTPVFTDDIKFIVFRPYWNVPPGILRRTVIPGIMKNNSYLTRENFEVTDSGGRLVSPSDDLVAGLRSGKYFVRQKPGPTNALGLIKFMFPKHLFSLSAQHAVHRAILQVAGETSAQAVFGYRSQPSWPLSYCGINSMDNNRGPWS